MGQQAAKFAGQRSDPPRLLLVDGFAGPGRYATGEQGSPLIMLEALIEHDAFGRMGAVDFLYLFIEHDPRRVEHLRDEIGRLELPANVKAEIVEGEFESTFGDIVEDVHQKVGACWSPHSPSSTHSATPPRPCLSPAAFLSSLVVRR